TSHNQPTIVLELLATATNKELAEYFDRALTYADQLSAGEKWVVHFTCCLWVSLAGSKMQGLWVSLARSKMQGLWVSSSGSKVQGLWVSSAGFKVQGGSLVSSAGSKMQGLWVSSAGSKVQ
ncbi:19620_t:CDS:2, partial [Funneliformis geosporum]